jgi:TRAP-type uncharacterized transport system fused permease subunit
MTELLIILGVVWITSFVNGFTGVLRLGFKKEEYFQMLIKGFKTSPLRSLWKWLYLGVMYMVGIIVLLWYKSGEIPANWLKKVFHFIFFTPDTNNRKK